MTLIYNTCLFKYKFAVLYCEFFQTVDKFSLVKMDYSQPPALPHDNFLPINSGFLYVNFLDLIQKN